MIMSLVSDLRLHRVSNSSLTLPHYSEVVECEEFLTLPSDQVIQLISCDRLSVANEEKVSVRAR